MPHELVIAIFGGLGAMLGWGLADFFGKITIDQIGDVVSLVWAHIFGTLVFVLVYLFQLANGQQFFLPTSGQIWFGLIFFGALQALVYFLLYRGFGRGPVSLLNPVFASFTGLVALISILFFGEIVGQYLPIGLATIFIGVMLINLDFQALKERRVSLTKIPGMKEIAIATILATIWTLGWDRFVGGHDWFGFAFYMYAFMTLVMLIVAKWRGINLIVSKNSAWKFLFLVGFCEAIAYTSISYGYSLTSHTSVVALLSGAFSLPTIILARLYLNEKISQNQAIGGFIIVLGTILLAVV
jgi:drug/metabolite transporter (DMT)-like permease